MMGGNIVQSPVGLRLPIAPDKSESRLAEFRAGYRAVSSNQPCNANLMLLGAELLADSRSTRKAEFHDFVRTQYPQVLRNQVAGQEKPAEQVKVAEKQQAETAKPMKAASPAPQKRSGKSKTKAKKPVPARKATAPAGNTKRELKKISEMTPQEFAEWRKGKKIYKN